MGGWGGTGHGLGPKGNLSNVTCRPRDMADLNKRSKIKFFRDWPELMLQPKFKVNEIKFFFMKDDFDNKWSGHQNMITDVGVFLSTVSS